LSAADLTRLVTLAALWGMAFMFLRIAAPSLGAILAAELRVLIAGVLLAAYAIWVGERLAATERWRAYLIVGSVSSAIPFALYSFASIYTPAGINAIINGMSPMFGAIAAALLLGDALTLRRGVALALGLAGIYVLVGDPAIDVGPMTQWAILAGLGAALCYGFSGVATKLLAPGYSPLAMSAGTQLASAVLLAPLLVVAPPPGPITGAALAAATALGVLCSGVGYLLYFRLLANVGPVKTLLVTFLIPVFGVFWGVVFLGERVTPRTLAGGTIVLLAIWVETTKTSQRLFTIVSRRFNRGTDPMR
jgi:drug/metabolite transporter (DMT)-like permease